MQGVRKSLTYHTLDLECSTAAAVVAVSDVPVTCSSTLHEEGHFLAKKIQ